MEEQFMKQIYQMIEGIIDEQEKGFT